jgi:hypothetical protein
MQIRNAVSSRRALLSVSAILSRDVSRVMVAMRIEIMSETGG